MLAKRYGAGGTYAPEFAGLTDYRSWVSWGLGQEAVGALLSAEEALPKYVESIELKDLSGATNVVIQTTGDVETALKTINDPQIDVAWVAQTTRDLAGVREAMARMRDELANKPGEAKLHRRPKIRNREALGQGASDTDRNERHRNSRYSRSNKKASGRALRPRT